MNQQFDVIIIGDSKQGKAALRFLASANQAIKFAFISRDFKTKTTHDFLNVEYIKDEVVFTDYRNRLFGCYLKSGSRLFSTHIVFATGVQYEPLTIKGQKVPCVYNTTDDLPKQSKLQPAVVIGDSDENVKLAIAVAKKYKQVYLCSKTLTLQATSSNLNKLAASKNIVVLPNAEVVKAISSDGMLEAVELSNYSQVTCSAVFVKTQSSPETSYVSSKLISKNNAGYLVVSDCCESTLVPKCFAIGSCSEKNTKQMTAKMLDIIVKDFKEG